MQIDGLTRVQGEIRMGTETLNVGSATHASTVGKVGTTLRCSS